MAAAWSSRTAVASGWSRAETFWLPPTGSSTLPALWTENPSPLPTAMKDKFQSDHVEHLTSRQTKTWRRHCIAGKALDWRHHRVIRDVDEVPMVHVDCCVNQKGDSDIHTLLNCVDCKSGLVASSVWCKGPDVYAVRRWCSFCSSLAEQLRQGPDECTPKYTRRHRWAQARACTAWWRDRSEAGKHMEKAGRPLAWTCVVARQVGSRGRASVGSVHTPTCRTHIFLLHSLSARVTCTHGDKEEHARLLREL